MQNLSRRRWSTRASAGDAQMRQGAPMGFTVLNLAIGAFAVGAAAGYHLGFLSRIASWLGALGGLWVAASVTGPVVACGGDGGARPSDRRCGTSHDVSTGRISRCVTGMRPAPRSARHRLGFRWRPTWWTCLPVARELRSRARLAVLRVSGIQRPPLHLTTEPGAIGAVFRNPRGQDGVRVASDGVGRRDRRRRARHLRTITGHPACGGRLGRARATRLGSAAGHRRRPGVGVAFAIAPDRPGTAYALATSELRAALGADNTAAVDSGPCI